MRNYSRQLDKFIECKPYANSYYRPQDSRTNVAYFIDNTGLIHSNSFNYSIISINPVSADEFKQLIAKETETKVSFV